MLHNVDERGKSKTNVENYIEYKKKEEKKRNTSVKVYSLGKKEEVSKNIALYVPLELRPVFRDINKIDPSVRPSNIECIKSFFSKCCSIPSNTRRIQSGSENLLNERYYEKDDSFFFKNIIPSVLNKTVPTGNFCILWTRKDTKKRKESPEHTETPNGKNRLRVELNGKQYVKTNDNQYHWINGQNVRARVIMYEWFVGPINMSEDEKQGYNKRRGRTRKRGRTIRMTCENSDCCINPLHMHAKMSKEMERSILEEKRAFELNLEEPKILKKRKIDNVLGDGIFANAYDNFKSDGSIIDERERNSFIMLQNAYRLSMEIVGPPGKKEKYDTIKHI